MLGLEKGATVRETPPGFLIANCKDTLRVCITAAGKGFLFTQEREEFCEGHQLEDRSSDSGGAGRGNSRLG